MSRFQNLLRRIDEALMEASGAGGDAEIVELAQRRGELERALTSAEAAWLDLSEQAGNP